MTAVFLLKRNITHRVEWTASGPQMQSDIKLNVVISENKNHETEGKIAANLKGIIEQRAQHLMKQLQQEKADALGVGQFFRKKMTEEQLKNWKQQWFPELKHEITVEVKILSSIYLKAPNKIKKPE